ncbi:hypothetical protein ACT7DC_09495 [Bacillus cereus]
MSIQLATSNDLEWINNQYDSMRWYSKTGTQYRDKLFYIRGVSDEKNSMMKRLKNNVLNW